MPLLSFFGLWDSYLSASLYSSNTASAAIHVDEATKDRLPETVRERALANQADGTGVISVTGWSWEELNVPAYPEGRVFKNVARHACAYAREPSEVTLVIQGKPSPVDGSRDEERYDCSDL